VLMMPMSGGWDNDVLVLLLAHVHSSSHCKTWLHVGLVQHHGYPLLILYKPQQRHIPPRLLLCTCARSKTYCHCHCY
jgi:hypothetical protein